MKTIIANPPSYYTDPIVYEEGFFKDKDDEIRFLKKVEASNQKAEAQKSKKKQSVK